MTEEQEKRLARYIELGKTMSRREIAEREGVSVQAVISFCRRHGVSTLKGKYTITDKVIAARERRISDKQGSKETQKILNNTKIDTVEQRKQEFKAFAQDNVLCQQWV